jgi:hypothetical protein
MPVFVGGIITGVVLAGFVGSLAKLEMPPFDAFERFQTLIVGLVAIGVALATYYHHRRVAAATQRRLEIVSLASLSENLSEISEYATKCMKVAQRYQGLLQSGSNDPGPTVPDVNRETIKNLANAAANLGSQPISDLLNTYQVQNTRLVETGESYRVPAIGAFVHRPNWRDARKRIDEAARLYILSGRLFDEARQGWQFLGDDVSQEEIDKCVRFQLGLTSTDGTNTPST